MPDETLVQHIDTDELRRCLSEFAAGQDEFNHALVEWFDRLERVSLDLLERQRQWWSQQREGEEALRRREEALREREQRLEQLEQELAEKRRKLLEREAVLPEIGEGGQEALARIEGLLARWEEVGKRLESLPEAGGSADAERIAEQIRELLGEQQTGGEILTQLKEELSRLGGVPEEVRSLKGELQDTLADLDRRWSEMLADRGNGEQDETVRELEAKLRRLEEELSAAEQDRIALETELEVVRNRAAELLDMLSEQRRQMAEERSHWSGELKRLRRLMEVLLDRQIDTGAPGEYEAAGQSHPRVVGYEEQERTRAVASGGSVDPVLESVSAQFEILQKDLSRRRRNNTG
ncbi:hypothetical protein JCM19992_31940 [Thermostilla marina]